MGKLLEICDLEVARCEQVVLSVEHLTLREGEVMAVIGPNGAGKSTLLLTLNRLLQPVRGQINFRGKSIFSEDELTYRRRIGLVLQDPLLMDATVFDNVAMGLRFRHLPRRIVTTRVDEWLDRLGIVHLRNRRARNLSGGEAQRVSLARAFVLQPELLLLDEPFSALDAPSRARLLEDFQGLLQDTSVTTLFITHDLDEALFLGERVAVLLQGRLRQYGAPQEVFSAPIDRDVATFVGVETVLPGRVVEANEGQLRIKANGLVLDAVGEATVGRQVLLCLRPEDVTLWHSNNLSPSSARNRLKGTIERMSPQGPLVRVVMDCGFPLVALITRASTEELQLAVGQSVVAAFKASAVHLIPR